MRHSLQSGSGFLLLSYPGLNPKFQEPETFFRSFQMRPCALVEEKFLKKCCVGSKGRIVDQGQRPRRIAQVCLKLLMKTRLQVSVLEIVLWKGRDG